ncbi:MAG: MFS transporter [Parcubacteria group bacterium]|nr:MFS transporter [Parcubacteria group bacterium]
MFRRTPKTKNILPAIYLSAFFLSLHFSITLYINSSFLAGHFDERAIGVIYTLGALGTIITLSLIPKILRRFGNYAATVFFTILEILLFLGLSFLSGSFILAAIFIVHQSLIAALLFNFDVFTESNSKDETTGKTRGLFLTTMNFATVLGPFLAGMFISDANFSKVYTLAAIFLLPVLLVAVLHFRTFKDPEYREFKWGEATKKIWHNKDIHAILMTNFLLQFFYSWMIIYMPVYLNMRMGFDWTEIGTIFGIMLLPFVFFELPLGEIADKRLGEKEILIAGFFILALSTFSLSFISEKDVVVWAILLFFTRIGAAAVEIMSETYFFKKINASDTNTLSFFRHTRPIAFFIGPLAASVFLSFFDIQYLFLALGILILLGIRYSLLIEDTK